MNKDCEIIMWSKVRIVSGTLFAGVALTQMNVRYYKNNLFSNFPISVVNKLPSTMGPQLGRVRADINLFKHSSSRAPSTYLPTNKELSPRQRETHTPTATRHIILIRH